ncbi:membrane protein DedA, SNARE-associated domain [Faunimonas pinastri]|uniref:Membrane protein DedA, SNARE-associated domain n=1 Tax=Faunimonas pinastri TaxID=1855383 RepID=A0A1H9P2N5_9HYPH|nr:DedA family protein [Faunimonas pinastri]SER42486.1 membrane protein DedA, SNARE-associated domain [Faunimonas pinastri]
MLDHQAIIDLIGHYGLWLVFGFILLESIGLPLPGETALIAASLFAGSTHQISPVSVIITAALAGALGGSIAHWIGKRVGLPVLARYGSYIHLPPKRLKVGRYLFAEYGNAIVFVGRFVIILRAIVGLLAGANQMSWQRFGLANLVASIVWACLYGIGCYYLGAQINRYGSPVAIGLLVLALLIISASLWFFRRHEKQLEVKAEAAFPGPLVAEKPVGGRRPVNP